MVVFVMSFITGIIINIIVNECYYLLSHHLFDRKVSLRLSLRDQNLFLKGIILHVVQKALENS